MDFAERGVADTNRINYLNYKPKKFFNAPLFLVARGAFPDPLPPFTALV